MAKFLIVSFFLVGIACHAQIKNFSVYVGAGVPLIPSVEINNVPTFVPVPAYTGFQYAQADINLEESFSNRRAFQLRGQFDYPVTGNVFLTSGLSLNYGAFKKNIQVTGVSNWRYGLTTLIPPITATANGLRYGSIIASSYTNANGEILINQDLRTITTSENVGNTTAMLVQVPVLIGTAVFNNKLQVRTGPVVSYLLRSTEIKQSYTGALISESKDASRENFTKLSAGISLQTTYLISPHVGIDVTAQKFFSSIYEKNEQNSGKAKYTLLLFGVSYHF